MIMEYVKWEKEREKEEGFLKYVNAYILFGQTIEQRIEIKIIDKLVGIREYHDFTAVSKLK